MNSNLRSPAAQTAETPAKAWLRALELTSRACRDPANILPRIVHDWALRYGHTPALIGADQSLSFRELTERVNRVSRFALAAGVAPGETIGLLMGNRPDFVALWLGLTQVGAVVALLNFHLQGAALAHSLRSAGARRVIVDEGRLPNFEAARAAGADEHELWFYGGANDGFRQSIEPFDGGELSDDERPIVSLADPALLIYTSGATGLPKAAKVSHRRIVEWSHWFAGTRRHDRRRPYVRLPANVSQRRRRERHRRAADQRRLRGHRGTVLRARLLRRYGATRVHGLPIYRRTLPLSRQGAAVARGAAVEIAPRLRQRHERRSLARLRAALPRGEGARILRGDRRQFLTLQRRGKSRRDRPYAGLPGIARPGRAGSFRRRGGSARARAGRLLHSLCAGRGRRGVGPHRRRGGVAFRGLPRRGGLREEDPSRRLSRRRRLGAIRRPHAPRRGGISTFSSIASATPIAGKARMSRRSKSRRSCRAVRAFRRRSFTA